jgi:hypothetical protein
MAALIMTPRQFFDEVAEPNAQLAIADRSNLRHAVNAIMTLDAVFGILHAALPQATRKREAVPERDNEWKNQLAGENQDYRLLRDTAFTIKHGELTELKKPRLIRRADQVREAQGGFQANAFSSGFQIDQIWIMGLDDSQRRANEVIERVVDFAKSKLTKYGM